MALKYTPGTGKPQNRLPDSSAAESAHLSDYLRQMLAEYAPYLVPLQELRKDLKRQLKGQPLSQFLRQS